MLIYIVRHGETRANVEGYLQGWSDDPLNEHGEKLAVLTGRAMQRIRFDCCISSPLLRARQTAEIILRESGTPGLGISFEDRIKEINMGDWERKKFRPEEREVDAEQMTLFFTDPFSFNGFPGGETMRQVATRTQAFLTELIERDDHRTYLLVTHGFALRTMLNFLYEAPSDFWHGHVPYNCAVNVVEGKNRKGTLIVDDRIYYDPSIAVDQYATY